MITSRSHNNSFTPSSTLLNLERAFDKWVKMINLQFILYNFLFTIKVN